MHLKNRLFIGLFTASLVTGATQWEGTRYTPYYDIVGVLTVCQGYTGSDIAKGKRYTPQECKAFLEKELRIHQEGMLKCIKVPITQYQHDAFLLFTYNVGVNAFCTSTSVTEKLNSGDYKAACDGLLKWSYVTKDKKKVFVQGLHNRRIYERKMCYGQLHKANQVRSDYSPDYRSYVVPYVQSPSGSGASED